MRFFIKKRLKSLQKYGYLYNMVMIYDLERLTAVKYIDPIIVYLL